MKRSEVEQCTRWIMSLAVVTPIVALVAGCGGGAGSSMLQTPSSGGGAEALSVVRTGTPVPTPRPTATPSGGVKFVALTYAPQHANDVMHYRQTLTVLGQSMVLNISIRTGAAMTVTNGRRTGSFFPVRQYDASGRLAFTDYDADTAVGLEQIGDDAGPGNSPAGTRRFIDALRIPNNLAMGQSETQTSQVVGTQDFAVIKTHIRTVKVVGVETVTVPAGTFHNCLKLIISETDKDAAGHAVLGNGVPLYYWFAPGVGIVKTVPVSGTSIKQELVSFNVGGHTRPL